MIDYSTLRQELIEEIKSDPKTRAAVQKMSKSIIDNTATYNDAYKLADVLGNTTGTALEKAVASLGEEELAELAAQVINPVYRNMQNTLLSAGRSVQSIFNDNNGLGVKPVNVKNDEDRLNNILKRFSEAENFEKVKFLTQPYVAENIAKSAVTDSVKRNADNFDRAGLEVEYIRSDGAGCCSWCSGIVGKYTKDNLPSDFWRVHKGCNCTFEYKVGGTHTKIKYGTDKNGKLRKETEEILSN